MMKVKFRRCKGKKEGKFSLTLLFSFSIQEMITTTIEEERDPKQPNNAYHGSFDLILNKHV